MAYNHSKYEAQITSSGGNTWIGLTTAAAEVGRWSPGFMPHIVRAVSITILGATGLTATPVISIRKTTSAGAADATGEEFAQITLATAALATTSLRGNVYYAGGLDTEIQPGQELVLANTVAVTGAGDISANVYVEPRWETPANLSQMTVTVAT